MTIQSVLRGVVYPNFELSSGSLASFGTMDAAGEKVAHIGRLLIEGRGTSKVLSAAGGGSIVWRASAVTWANASTALDVGLQDADVTTGNPVRPDGTYDVKRTLVPGTDALANGIVTTSMTGGSGSKTLSHGDLISVVWDMTARAGSDAVSIGMHAPLQQSHTAFILTNTGSWAAQNGLPQVGIVFDDGTRGMFDFSIPLMSAVTFESFSDSTNPDERGMSFEVPWDCKIDAVIATMLAGAANADFEVQVYSDPFGTPTSVLPGGTAIAVTAETLRAYTGDFRTLINLPSEVSLTRNTRYAVTIKATGAGSPLLPWASTWENVAWKQFMFGGANASKVTRNNGSGAFTEADTMAYNLGVRISGFHDTSSGGGGGASFSAYAM